MDIIIYSKSKEIKKSFAPIERSKKYSVTYHDPLQIHDFVKQKGKCLVYLDISSVSDSEQKKIFKQIQKIDHINTGIIDPKGTVKDVAGLFHFGIVDYLGKDLLREEVSMKRIKTVLDFKTLPEAGNESNHQLVEKEQWKISEDGWKGIKSGGEYTFCFLYVELDLVEEWKKKSGKTHLNEIQNIFYNHIEKTFKPHDGKIWMWMNQSGVVLFPFNGKSCDPVLSCIRIILNRPIISIEEFGYNTLITYKMALHIGNTVYQDRGKTGGIVSDSLNFLFHLGKQFAHGGHFYLTQNVCSYVPHGIMELFHENGSFEGVPMYSMKLPRN